MSRPSLRPRSLGLVLLALVAMAPTVRAQGARIPALREYLAASAALGRINGVVLVADSGRILVDTAFGYADFEHRVRNTPDTRFRVASVTKQFTAMAVMMLQEEGRLDVRDPIGKHLDSVPDAWRDVTIHHLLRHSSGISDYEEWFEGYTTQAYSDYMSQAHAAERIVHDARSKPLDFSPGSKDHYSNTGYVLLGFIIERASGVSYQDFIRTRILEPLGMRRSLMDRSREILPDRATGYALRDGAIYGPYWNGLTPEDLQNAHYQLMEPPQGEAGLVTTSRDLYKWDQALYTDRLVSRASLDSVFAPGHGDYGYGWFIRTSAPGTVSYQHSGGLPGFSCYIMRIPSRHGTIIVLTNLETLGRTVRDLAAILAGESVVAPTARHVVPTDSAVHARWTGTYRAADGDSLDVIMDDILAVRWRGHFTAGMFPESERDFFLGLTGGTARFREIDGTAELVIRDAAGAEQVRAVR